VADDVAKQATSTYNLGVSLKATDYVKGELEAVQGLIEDI
jgi:hypothetical protein